MPVFSAFTPYGQLEFSSLPATPENVHNALVRATGGNYNTDVDDENGAQARLYAWSRQVARAKQELRRAGNQHEPLKVTDLLPTQERSHHIVPEPGSTSDERRSVLAVRSELTRGNVKESVENALTTLLGDDFVAYVPLTPAEGGTAIPADPSTVGTFVEDTRGPQAYKIITSIAFTGTPVLVQYADIDGSSPNVRVNIGQKLVIDPDKDGLREVVTVTNSVDLTFPVAGSFFEATYTKAHAADAAVVTSFPFWNSTRKHNVVVVKNGRAVDPELRRKVDDVFARLLQGISTWDIIEEDPAGSGCAGPFEVGVGKIGVTPIGKITF